MFKVLSATYGSELQDLLIHVNQVTASNSNPMLLDCITMSDSVVAQILV
jgi:hypothetical protein